jgi:hypothetical protein
LQPFSKPSHLPTCRPSSQPSNCPTNQPSVQPISQPSIQPSSEPTASPSTLSETRYFNCGECQSVTSNICKFEAENIVVRVRIILRFLS